MCWCATQFREAQNVSARFEYTTRYFGQLVSILRSRRH